MVLPVWAVVLPSTMPQAMVPLDLGDGTAQGNVNQTDTRWWYRLAQAVVPPVPEEPGMGKF